MKINTVGTNRVDEGYKYGTYVWRCEDGEVAGDGDGNIMNRMGPRGSQECAKAITEAAEYYGAGPGHVEFWPGQVPVSDEEYESQLAMARMGLAAPTDFAAILDEMEGKRKNG